MPARHCDAPVNATNAALSINELGKERNMIKAGITAISLVLISSVSFAATKQVDGIEVRDWAAIDVDKDHYISAQEMEAALRSTWAKSGQPIKN